MLKSLTAVYHSLSIVSMAEYTQVYERESISTVTGVQAVVDIVMQKEDVRLPEQKVIQPAREREDDWFLLLDVVSKKTPVVPSGTYSYEMSYSFHGIK